ncbi:MAG: hypothetical protein AAF657_20535 [Acidobacteriota bacterium]
MTGSVAAIYYGEPRFTNDIDVVVDLALDQVPDFLASFPPGEYYLSEEALQKAVARQGMCNIIHVPTSLKVDVMIAADTLFNRSRFERARRVRPADDLEGLFASAEDVILKKMDFFRQGGSEKHLRDITGILMVSGDQLDHDYIESWADQLGLETIWRTIRYLVRQKQSPKE